MKYLQIKKVESERNGTKKMISDLQQFSQQTDWLWTFRTVKSLTDFQKIFPRVMEGKS